VEIFNDYIERGLVTKRDLREVELRITSNVDLKIKELEFKLTVRTAAIVGSIVGFFSLLENCGCTDSFRAQQFNCPQI
jgi:hypothetical protein